MFKREKEIGQQNENMRMGNNMRSKGENGQQYKNMRMGNNMKKEGERMGNNMRSIYFPA